MSLNDKCTTRAGLSMLPKIKSEHLRLNSYSRMKVYLASQVSFVHFWYYWLHGVSIMLLYSYPGTKC